MSALSADEIQRRLREVSRRVRQAAEKAGRDPSLVQVLAVTKGHPEQLVRNAARAGLTRFGENRVNEAAAKIDALHGELPDLIWKLIGPLQTNKAKAALQYFSTVESLDRERLASKLEHLLAAGARRFSVLLEFNLGAEPTKSGAEPQRAFDFAGQVLSCPHLEVQGLMTVPPFTQDPEAARPYFKRLVEIRDRLADRFSVPLAELSMGMSHDFPVAVEEGSTEIRIGTELFGPRETA